MADERQRYEREGFQLRELPGEAGGPSYATATDAGAAVSASSYDDLGELPRGYGDDTIFLVAQEPHWLFTYWDIDISKHPGGATFLRYCHDDGSKEGEIEVPFETRNWYIPVHRAGSGYFIEIGYYRGETWHAIARSATVKTPPERLSDAEDFDFATLPFHLGFQRLLDNIRTAAQMGEDLVQALARMQRSGDFSAFSGLSLPALTREQRSLLAALLGPDLIGRLSSAGLSSAEMEAQIRAHLEEQLSSAGGSELLARAREVFGVSSLFSGAAFGSEVFGAGVFSGAAAAAVPTESASWSAAAISSWAAAALSSWLAKEVSSAGAVSSQSGVSSWSVAAVSSWLQAAVSSWGVAAVSSYSLAAVSSWIQAIQSSWSQAAVSSWGLGAVSSWSGASVTSWGGSETVSSFGFGRQFFMHVNAEVIFYGGTDPRATVTVDGEPIQLYPDGTFRYHFVFPDADYEIPIAARSPDGVETRVATLRFSRETRKLGDIAETAQPVFGAPMGRVSP